MKKMTYKFNLNYLKNAFPNVDVKRTSEKYLEQITPFLKVRFKYHTVKVQNIKQKGDEELHDVHFDCDSRQEEIQTTSIVRSHISSMFKNATEWIVDIDDPADKGKPDDVIVDASSSDVIPEVTTEAEPEEKPKKRMKKTIAE